MGGNICRFAGVTRLFCRSAGAYPSGFNGGMGVANFVIK